MLSSLYDILQDCLDAIEPKVLVDFNSIDKQFEFIFSDQRTQELKLPDEYNGRSITNIAINNDHELITTMSDGAIITLGTIEFTKE